MHPLQVPFTGSLYGERFAISRAFFYMSFRVPSKGALLPGSPGRAPIARDGLFPGPSFTYLSNALVKKPPSIFPQQDLYGESCPFPEPSFTYLSESLMSKVLLSKSLVKEPPSRFLHQSHLWREMPLSESSFTYLFTPRKQEPRFRPIDPDLIPLFHL